MAAPNNKDECVTWLRKHSVSTTGTLAELQMRIRKFNLYPTLAEKLRKKTEHHFCFETSLDPLLIPPPTAAWRTDEKNYPTVTEDMFKEYVSKKREGSIGQQHKAGIMFKSRKIVSIRVHKADHLNIFVKGNVKKSYGVQSRPAVILFCGLVPSKAYCVCPVGVCGVCCHVLAILIYLKHYCETNEKKLELTCTQQIQKWHRRSKKGSSIPMMPLREIKISSARPKPSFIEKVDVATVNSKTSKRDVMKMKEDIERSLKGMNMSFEAHCYNVMNTCEAGKNTSLLGHLSYKYTRMAAECLADHDYCVNTTYDIETITPQHGKLKYIQNNIDRVVSDKIQKIDKVPLPVNNAISELHKNINTQISENITELEINVANMCPHNPSMYKNYVNVKQNSDEWHMLRQNKITGSRLPSLIGLGGNKNFDIYWQIVLHGLKEEDMINTNFCNFIRGHKYEKEALKHFCVISGANAMSCGFFNHPDDGNYGASPDGLVAPGILLEIKTRAVHSDGPLTNITGSHYIQCQLQMVCAISELCILMSYHPETNNSNCFLIRKNNQILNVIKTITDSVINQVPILDWEHKDAPFCNLEKCLIGKIPDFQSLKSLRIYINKLARSVPTVKFISC